MADATSYCPGWQQRNYNSPAAAAAAKDTLAESKESMLDNSSKDTQLNNWLLLKATENVILLSHWLSQESVLTP